MSDTFNNEGYTYGKVDRVEEPLKIDFSKIIVPDRGSAINQSGFTFNAGEVADNISAGKVEFGSIASAYQKDEAYTVHTTPSIINDENSNITYLNTTPAYSATTAYTATETKTTGNVFANTTKPSSTELQRIVQKLDKLEKMINPNSKKSLILWEEDNSFKGLISTIVKYANECDTTAEFPIEVFDKLKALSIDVDTQIKDGSAKIIELKEQQKTNPAIEKK